MGRAFEFRKARKMKRWSNMAKTFTRIGREIIIAVKESGPDPSSNSRLRAIIQNAKSANMPKENIERAIKKASEKSTDNFKEILLEGYAPNGIAIFIECTTDNINRTVADVRAIFNKNDGELGKNGSLEFLFDRKGLFVINTAMINMNLEEFEMELIDFGLEEFEVQDETCTLICEFEQFGTMQDKLNDMAITVQSAEIQRIPHDTKKLSLDQSVKIMNIVEKFEENDDVQKVFHNLNVSEELISELNNS